MDRSTHHELMNGTVQHDTCLADGASLQMPELPPAPCLPREEQLAKLFHSLEVGVVPRLVHTHLNVEPVAEEAQAPDELQIQAFARSVIGDDHQAVWATIHALRERGLSVPMICTGLLTPAARHMGWMWDEDLCDFTEVTLGVGRLQQLMHEMSPDPGLEPALPLPGRRMLLVCPPGEQHSFGLSMVLEFFRRDGWDAVGGPGEKVDPMSLLRAEWFDVVGLSVGHVGRLEWARTTIKAIRQHSRNPSVQVLLGGPVVLTEPAAAGSVGADATAGDGAGAPALAAGLLRRRARCG